MRPGLFQTRFISFRVRLEKMAELRLLANMNISPETVNALNEKGIDIVRVSQLLAGSEILTPPTVFPKYSSAS